MKTNATVHKPSDLHYNPITTEGRHGVGGIVVARYRAKNSHSRGEGIAKKHFSAIKDTTIIPHSRSPFDRNFPSKYRAPFCWISDFPFCAAGKRSFVLVPSMKWLFPLLWTDFVEKYRWRGYRSLCASLSFLSKKVKVAEGRERVPCSFCLCRTNIAVHRERIWTNLFRYCSTNNWTLLKVCLCRQSEITWTRFRFSEKSISRRPRRSLSLSLPEVNCNETSWYIRSLSHETHVLFLSGIGNVRSIWFLFRRERIRVRNYWTSRETRARVLRYLSDFYRS